MDKRSSLYCSSVSDEEKVYNSATFSPLEVVPDEAEDDSRPRLREVSEAEDMVELLSEFCLKM
jgi:hypothetical protein